MLLIIVAVLLFFSSAIWLGVPIFLIGNAVSKIVGNLVVVHLFIALSVGFLFSLFLVPINIEVAQKIASIKQIRLWKAFVRIQVGWLIVVAVLFEFIVLAIIFMEL
ncbi:hypothetical protein [Gracilibacillus kekensis]|uniref:Uncharacterized protein n=1 Tax=Gracilibacillus kekensis TaxID=1027249 RepID=A0A1M7IWZ4_9BACI|nr:hypothetical protein [Gracilibacillus kekensis]SHM45324.1 hypothetical protein SAMN05216179_0182 [Gracilibacillus kekensis]